MILSKKNKFVFVKGKKVAGTSLEILLSAVCGQEDIITPITPVDERFRILSGQRTAQNYGASEAEHDRYISSLKELPKEEINNIKKPKQTYKNHMPFVDILKSYGEIPNDWSVVAIERCPYRKIISYANWKINAEHYRQTGQTVKTDLNVLKKYIAKMLRNGKINDVKNIDMYKDKNSVVRTTNVLHLERLDEDVAKLMSSLGIKAYPKLPHMKKGLSANDMDLHDILSKKQIEKINKIFLEEFDFFGYSMMH